MSQFLTKNDLIKEFIKCGKNPAYFIDSYCQITTLKEGVVPFKTWDFQKKLLEDFNDYPHNIVVKSRQLGLSTLVAAYIVWLALFNREKYILVVATKFNVASKLVKKVKKMFKALPSFFDKFAGDQPMISVDNKTSFILFNGSEIVASTTSADAGRADSVSLLVIDEAAHIADIDEMWSALAPTLSTGGRSIVFSSPYGVGTWFHEEYSAAEKGTNEFHATKLMWDVRPDRDEEWKKQEKRKMSQRKWEQEYCCSFLSSGDTVIETQYLTNIFEKLKKPIFKTGFDNNIHIWEKYNSNNNYLVVCDVARGDGADFSTIHVLKLETMDQVVEYKGKVNTDIFPNLIFDIGNEYGIAMIVVENNTLGWEVCQKLIKLEYKNIYFSEKGTQDYVPPYNINGREDVIPGFTMSPKTRPLVINRLEEFIRNDLIRINSSRTYNELETFIWNKGRAEASRGKNDDLVMPLAIACWIKDIALNQSLKGLEYKKVFLNSMFSAKKDFNTNVPGMQNFNKKTSFIKQPSTFVQQKMYGWLLKE